MKDFIFCEVVFPLYTIIARDVLNMISVNVSDIVYPIRQSKKAKFLQ